MPYQGGGLAAGLASGFTGWMQGKQEAEQRAYERKQEADRIAREKEREAFARLVQENAMKLANAQNQRAETDQAIQLDQGGYSAWNPETGAKAFEQAGTALGNPLAGFLAGYAQNQTTQPGAPVKVRKSVAELNAETARRQQYQDRTDEQAYQDRVRAEDRKAQAERDARQFGQQKELRAMENEAQLQAIEARLSAKGAGQTLPMGEVDKLNSQSSAVAQLNELETLLGQGGAKGSMGLWPNILGSGVANRVDNGGTNLRAAMSNISSLTYLDRSGAAVTPSEDARLQPLVPQPTDPADVAIAKLRKLRAHIAREMQTVADYYGQQGYALPKLTPPNVTNQNANVNNDRAPGSALRNFDTGVRR